MLGITSELSAMQGLFGCWALQANLGLCRDYECERVQPLGALWCGHEIIVLDNSRLGHNASTG